MIKNIPKMNYLSKCKANIDLLNIKEPRNDSMKVQFEKVISSTKSSGGVSVYLKVK